MFNIFDHFFLVKVTEILWGLPPPPDASSWGPPTSTDHKTRASGTVVRFRDSSLTRPACDKHVLYARERYDNDK